VSELAKTTVNSNAIAREPEIDVGNLLQLIVDRGITAESAGAVKELVLLHEHRQDRDRKQSFITAFARARRNLKTIHAEKAIPDKQGNVKWFYAPLEDLQDAVEPILEMEDITLRFDSRREGNLCVGICWLSHAEGHQEKAECAVNAANCEGGDLGAIKKAKRGALTAILGLKTRHLSGDAGVLGEYITADQAKALESRLVASGMGERKQSFLKMAKAETFETIRQGMYGTCDKALRKAEEKAAQTGSGG
jgi:hypothetical protein